MFFCLGHSSLTIQFYPGSGCANLDHCQQIDQSSFDQCFGWKGLYASSLGAPFDQAFMVIGIALASALTDNHRPLTVPLGLWVGHWRGVMDVTDVSLWESQTWQPKTRPIYPMKSSMSGWELPSQSSKVSATKHITGASLNPCLGRMCQKLGNHWFGWLYEISTWHATWPHDVPFFATTPQEVLVQSLVSTNFFIVPLYPAICRWTPKIQQHLVDFDMRVILEII